MPVFPCLRPLLTLAASVAAAFTLATGSARAAPLEAVVTFSILGDFVRQVGGERVAVHTLVGPDEDAHAFQPRPSDARRVGAAALVVANGLGFDDWILRLARSAGRGGGITIVSHDVTPLAGKTALNSHDDDHEHDSHGADPHAWQDVANARRYVAAIAAALAAADPDGAAVYRANAARYDAELAALDEDIRRRFAALPAGRRKVVSSHDAFGYFSHAYGIRFLAPAGVSGSAEPTARGVARLIAQIRAEKIPAVFIENIADPRLLDRIRHESGARIGGTLYSDALSGGNGPAADYIGMMRHNLRTLADALATPPPP